MVRAAPPVRTSGRPADDNTLVGVDDALATALGALDAGLAQDGGPRERRWRSKQRLALVVWGLGVGLAPLPGRPGQLGVGRTLPLRLEVGPWRPVGVKPQSRTSWR